MTYIGTSGFSYDDWKGRFYPEKMAKKDMLAYYARQFNTVEINATYYTIPGAASFASMDRNTPDDFQFVVKAHKDMTHVESPDEDTFDAFLGAIKPLADAGKLGCVLAQYPWSFKRTPENDNRLRQFKDRVGDLPAVVEFRNVEWVNDETFEMLRSLNLGFCSVDEPRLKGLMPPVAVATSDIGYVRFHGRNAKKWWHHDQPHERYDYLYSQDELVEWVPKVDKINAETRATYLFFNNHFQGKSAQNARMFARMLNLPLPTDTGLLGRQMTLGEDFDAGE
ncbi:MAG: hypothetical protein A2Z18_07255 [Armatimonadetes bacterium RBG_16_58_9]|nr:MAG: hypothetical protein A2Z18_07255 [Armatimonadetes bacterium RBG_16_58_9]